MITLRRSGKRHHDRHRKHDVWLTFDAKDRDDPLADGFGSLQILDEDRLSPGADLSRRPIAMPRSSSTSAAAMLEPGRHVVHELAQRQRAWLHIVQGDATLGDIVLTTGDGVGVTAERAVSLTARVRPEILLLDLGDRA